MKKTLLISMVVIFGVSIMAVGAMATTTIGTDISTGGTLDVTGITTLTNKLNVTDSQVGGLNGSIIKKTLTTGTYDGTVAGLQVKNYFEDTAPTVTGEFTGLYINVKQLEALSGDQSSLISGHNHGSAGTVAIDSGIRLYGDLTTIFKTTGNSTTGIDFSGQTISGSDIIFSNNETISNATNGVLAITSPSTTFSGKIDAHDQSSSDVEGSLIKRTLQDGITYSGGTVAGLMVKNYMDGTPTVTASEFTGLYVNVQDLVGLNSGSNEVSSIISGHNHGENILHAGLWLYGDLENAIKVSNGTSTNGINFSQQAISGSDIILSNGEVITNVVDGTISFGAANIVTTGALIMPTSAETITDGLTTGCTAANRGSIVIDAADNFFGCDGALWQQLNN